LEHEVFWKAIGIAFDGLIQSFRFHPIKFSQIAVQHHFFAANREDCSFDPFHRNQTRLPVHFMPFTQRWSQFVTTFKITNCDLEPARTEWRALPD
jgi:hypothetical protein